MLRSLARRCSTAVLLLATAIAHAQEPAASFEEALARVETQLEIGRWSQAKRMLLEELERREGDAQVAARLVELQEILLRCGFGVAHPPRRPEEVVSGELVRYQPARGEIHLRYRPARPESVADFVEIDSDLDLRIHPLDWNGPYTMRVSGSGQEKFEVVVTFDVEALAYVIHISEGVAMLRVGEDRENELVGDPQELGPAEHRELEVRVGARTLEVLVDGAPRLTADMPAGSFGRCGVLSFRGIDALELEGRAEPSWIQNRIDDESARARLEYETTHDPRAELPAWLRPFDLTPDADGPGREASAFAGFADAPQGLVAEAQAFLDDGDPAAGLAFAEALDDARAGARLKAWMRAVFLQHLGRRSEAREAAEAVFDLDRAELVTRLEWLVLLSETGDHAAALAGAQALTEEFPDRPEGPEALAGALLGDGRREEAADVLRRAAEAGVRSAETQFLERLLVRARRGPAWSRTNEYASRHYIVRSDLSRELCLEAAQELDGAHRMFEMRLGRLESRPDERLPVYIFSGQGTYLLYSRDLTGALPVHTAGMYSPMLQQLLIWNLPQRAEMLRTVRHEGFHQFLHRRVGAAPTWLQEGLAEYFSYSRLERGRWAHGDPVQVHLDVLRKRGFEWTPLAELLRLEPEAFYDEAGRHYAESWHWVHFLENSGVQNGRRLRALVDALAAGASTEAALEAVFPARELPELERARREHLAKP